MPPKKSGATIPAMLISGDTDPSRLIEASARAWPLLHKPVDSVHLRHVITELLAPAARERNGNTV